MTAMAPVLELIIDAHIVLILGFCLWWGLQRIIQRSRMRTDHLLQLRLLRIVLIVMFLSPVLAFLAATASQAVWPKAPVTISDVAVAVYLRGDISISAIAFEELLNARSRTLDAFTAGEIPWLTALAAGLIAGSLAILLEVLRTLFCIRRIIRDSYVWRRTASTDIRLSDTITVPFATRGVWRRHVVLPSSILTSPAEMKVVLAHEFEHLRQRDVEWELVFEFLRPLLYFNPVFHLWKRAFERVRELNCDQTVIESLGVSPHAYANCILRFCRQDRSTNVAAMNVAFVRSGSKHRSALEERILALATARPKKTQTALFGVLALTLTLGVILAAVSVRTPGDWSHDRIMLATIVNLERMEARNN